MCTVAGVPPEQVCHGGAGLCILLPLDQRSRQVPRDCRSVECGPIRLVAGPLLHGAGHAEYCASTQWLGHDTGAIIDESIAERVTIQLVLIPVLLGIIGRARPLHIHMIQMDGPHCARVLSPIVTPKMKLARDMRARSECDRLQPHAYGRGGLACGECAVMPHVCRPPVRTVSPDGGARGLSGQTTSV